MRVALARDESLIRHILIMHDVGPAPRWMAGMAGLLGSVSEEAGRQRSFAGCSFTASLAGPGIAFSTVLAGGFCGGGVRGAPEGEA